MAARGSKALPSPAIRAAATADSDEKRARLALRAYQLRVAGKSWWDISEELRITEEAASTLVAERIRAAAQLVDEGSRRTLLATELDRLDALQAAVWPQAMAGETKSVEAALKVIDRRARLLGLDAESGSITQSNTIVVPGSTSDYVAALRAIATDDRRQIAS